ncbi:MAG: hypothetical protein MJ168_05470 [Clostridia bacterium]|nr:hypothetical protein [Clostridia bacterium]
MENFEKIKEKAITAKQKKAIDMLIYQGSKKREVAEALKITPTTLSNWLNIGKNPHFVAAYEKELECADNLRKRDYRTAAQEAQKRLIELAQSDDEDVALKACKDILDRAGDKPTDNVAVTVPNVSSKLAAVFEQIGGEGLEE